MSVSTTTEPVGDPSGGEPVANEYLEGVFAPVPTEETLTELTVTGDLPRELDGRYLRNGPNPIDADPATYHWFLGSGMVHRKVIEAGGFDPNEWQGFGFGCGIDRLAMLKYGMDD